ncbi:MAG: hypothetical protein KC503_04945 [Myxococcales bacterium]|nr:hypothetical protein [Myxococcales bacterium]
MTRLVRGFAPLTLAAAMLLSSSAMAKTFTDIDAPIGGALVPGARAAVLARLSRFGVTHATLEHAYTTKLKSGAVVRFVQKHGGLPLLDANVAAVVVGNKLVAIGGKLAEVKSLSDDAILDANTARARLLAQLPARTRAGALITRTTLGLVMDGATARKVYELALSTQSPFQRLLVRVDAVSGKTLATRSALRHVQGLAYGTNPKQTQAVPYTLQGLAGDGSELKGEFANVQSCAVKSNKLECTRYAKPDTNGDFLDMPVEPSTSDPFTEVQAYYHVDTFHRWLRDTFSFARKRASQSIDVVVNYYVETPQGDQGVYNAFFGDVNNDGLGDVVMGQGNKRDFAYDGDVIYHEFTHSAVDETSNLTSSFDAIGFNHVPGALNEAFADLMSSFFTGDSKVGEYAGGNRGEIRDISGNATCPDDLIGETHEDGLLWSRAIWTVRQTLSDTKVFDLVVYNTMASLEQSPSFADAVKLLVKLAQASSDPTLAGKLDAEFKKRAVDTCERVIALDDVTPSRSGFLLGAGQLGLNLMPASLQYKIDVPANAIEMTITVIDRYAKWSGTTNVGAFVRKGQTVEFSTFKSKSDFTIANTAPSLTLKVGDSENTLAPGESYYVLPVNVGQYQGAFQLLYTIKLADPPDAGATPDTATTPDAGATPDTAATPDAGTTDPPQESGCSIAAGAMPTLPAVLLIVGLLALVTRRRRRR